MPLKVGVSKDICFLLTIQAVRQLICAPVLLREKLCIFVGILQRGVSKSKLQLPVTSHGSHLGNRCWQLNNLMLRDLLF
jgi:hypothetical protein